MDRRFLISALATDTVGIALSSVVYLSSLNAASLGSVALGANIAIIILAASAASSPILAAIGVVRRLGISATTAAGLGLASSVLGCFSLFFSFVSVVGFGDDQATCGGFPPGYWTSNNQVNRCSIWAVTHGDWVGPILLVILATSALIFGASVVTRVRLTTARS